MTIRKPTQSDLAASWLGLIGLAVLVSSAAAADCREDLRGPPFAGDFVDLDRAYGNVLPLVSDDVWSWQLLPNKLIYPSYLAGTNESRLSFIALHETSDAWLLDGTLGGRAGIVRYGNYDPVRPNGFQIDVEASARVRLDPQEQYDVRSTDYRVGLPLTYGLGRQQAKLAVYHVSSHVGDEFLLKNPGFPRLNYFRDAVVLGYSFYPGGDLRLYAEADFAVRFEVSKPWHFQFGLDWAPALETGSNGAPFFALNGHLRQENDFGGSLTVQAGWAWRGDNNDNLVRVGLQYFNGKSNQFSFFDDFEQQIGAGVWYDF